MAEIDDARILVAQSCRIIGKMDMTREPAGHVSWRIRGTDHVLIKGRGPGEAALRYVAPDGTSAPAVAGRPFVLISASVSLG